MNPGDFNRRLTLQTLSTSSDGAGGTAKDSWNDAFDFMAHVEPNDMSRRLNYNQIVTTDWTHRITTYYMGIVNMPGIRMRVVMEDGTILLINSVINNNYKNQLITLVCYADPDGQRYEFPLEAGYAYLKDASGNDVFDGSGNILVAKEV